MRKIFFFVMLLTAAMTANAKQYCQEPMVTGENTILLSCELFGTNYRLTIEAENLQGFGGSFCTINENQNVALSNYTSVSADNKKMTVNLPSSSVPVFYTPLYVLMPGEVAFGFPGDVEWGKCSADETKYTITVTQPAAGGSISADMAEAEYGTIVTLTATPDSGKKLAAWDVKDAALNAIEVSKTGTFVMPQSNVTVTATFKDQPVYTVATWYGQDEILREEVTYPVLWSITHNADGTLTFSVQVTGEVVGIVPQVNLKDQYNNMEAVEAAEGVFAYAYTLDEECEVGETVSGFFWLPYAGGVKRIDWEGYTVGATNDQPQGVGTISQESKAKSRKVIENGQLIIIRNGVRYDVTGAQVF